MVFLTINIAWIFHRVGLVINGSILLLGLKVGSVVGKGRLTYLVYPLIVDRYFRSTLKYFAGTFSKKYICLMSQTYLVLLNFQTPELSTDSLEILLAVNLSFDCH